jgi:hypothetical protein
LSEAKNYIAVRKGAWKCRHCESELTAGQLKKHAKWCPEMQARGGARGRSGATPPGNPEPLRASLEAVIRAAIGKE